MKVVKWSPMFPNRMFQEFDGMFEDFGGETMNGGFSPAVDVYEEGDMVVVEAPLPGIHIENIEVSIENDVLSIQGKSEKKTEVDDKEYYRKEVRYGSFHRAIALPSAVDGDKAEAKYSDGVLKVYVPKASEKAKKTIAVNKE